LCGVKDGPKPLHVREWRCRACGAYLDRDINAAVNVAKAAGLAVTACRAQVRPEPVPAQRCEAGTHPKSHRKRRGRRESPPSAEWKSSAPRAGRRLVLLPGVGATCRPRCGHGWPPEVRPLADWASVSTEGVVSRQGTSGRMKGPQ